MLKHIFEIFSTENVTLTKKWDLDRNVQIQIKENLAVCIRGPGLLGFCVAASFSKKESLSLSGQHLEASSPQCIIHG